MIALAGVGARAGAFQLRDVTASVARGAWALLLGPAGAGKTTLLETIAGIRQATAGRVLLRGADVTTVAPERRGVGIVYQRGFLFPHLSVDANVGYGATDRAYTAEVASRFGADVLRDRPVRSLSGGERQVVALVRALAPRPDILMLDEPWSALDPRARAKVRRELRALQREQGITVLQVTHDFQEARSHGDQAILMDAGRVVQAGAFEDVCRAPASPAVAGFLGVDDG